MSVLTHSIKYYCIFPCPSLSTAYTYLHEVCTLTIYSSMCAVQVMLYHAPTSAGVRAASFCCLATAQDSQVGGAMSNHSAAYVKISRSQCVWSWVVVWVSIPQTLLLLLLLLHGEFLCFFFNYFFGCFANHVWKTIY